MPTHTHTLTDSNTSFHNDGELQENSCITHPFCQHPTNLHINWDLVFTRRFMRLFGIRRFFGGDAAMDVAIAIAFMYVIQRLP